MIETLIRFELWEEIIALAPTPYLETTDVVYRQFQRHKALGLAYFNLDRVADGAKQLKIMELLLQAEQLNKKADKARAKVSLRNNPQKSQRALSEIDRRYRQKLGVLEKAVNELSGYHALALGDNTGALAFFDKPHNIPPERLALAMWSLDLKQRAVELAAEAVSVSPNQTQPLAVYTDLLYRSRRNPEAFKQFAKLRTLSASLDLDAPAFARLESLARGLGFSEGLAGRVDG